MKRFSEEQVYRAVLSGDLEIDGQGRVWRIRKRGWDRRQRRAASRPCERVRAEHDTGIYLMVRIALNGERFHTQASRLVWRHFNGPIPPGYTINHKDGLKKRNHPSNLEAVTYSQNTIHAIHVLGKNQRLLRQSGERNVSAKLSDEQVIEIRARYAVGGVTMESLAKLYGVRFQHISRLVRGARRSDQAGPTFSRDLRHAGSVRDTASGRFTSETRSDWKP